MQKRTGEVLSFGSFTLDLARRRLLRGTREVKLRPRSFDVFHYLVDNRGRLVTKAELMAAVWPDVIVTDDSVVQCLIDIRKALGDDARRIVKTVPRRGYVFDAVPRPPSVPSGEMPVIAVLPFTPIGATGEGAYLGLGLTDNLITRLSNVKRLVVRPTSAVRRYADSDQDTVAIGRELGADSVLEGTVQRVGQRIRVTVQLVSVGKGVPLWAEKLDEDFTNIFAVQDAIAARAAEALVIRLTGEERQLLAKRDTESPAAHEAYLRGRYFWGKRTEEGLGRAVDSFRRAIAIDPEYAAAYSGIADSFNYLGYWDYLSPRESWPIASEAASTSVRLDDSLAEGHAALAMALMHHGWDRGAAERHVERAIELDPTYAQAHHVRSHLLVATGRIEQSLAASRQALAPDPLNLPIHNHLTWHLYFARDYDGAIEHGKRTVELAPDFYQGRWYLGMAYGRRASHPEAIAELRQARALSDNSPLTVAGLGHALAAAGERGEAGSLLDELRALSGHRYVSPFHAAMIHLGLGETDAAIDRLTAAVAGRCHWMVYAGAEPMFDPLRSDPRFLALCDRAGLG
jgi:TolB-like protein/DNA-binding winged helix-turn-helix (wHTH) protein/Tfp pilus assembly protein PilF